MLYAVLVHHGALQQPDESMLTRKDPSDYNYEIEEVIKYILDNKLKMGHGFYLWFAKRAYNLEDYLVILRKRDEAGFNV